MIGHKRMIVDRYAVKAHKVARAGGLRHEFLDGADY